MIINRNVSVCVCVCVYIYIHTCERTKEKKPNKGERFCYKRGIWNKELSLIESSNFKESLKTATKDKSLNLVSEPKINGKKQYKMAV